MKDNKNTGFAEILFYQEIKYSNTQYRQGQVTKRKTEKPREVH